MGGKNDRPVWVIDSHVIDAADAAELFQMHDDGHVELWVTDTAHIETETAQDSGTNARLAIQIKAFDMYRGAFILNHSRIGEGVFASEEDGPRLRRVFAIIFPNREYGDDANGLTGTGLRCFRDAVHVSTAIQYGATGFVTADHQILNAAATIADEFDGFQILSVAEATDRSRGDT